MRGGIVNISLKKIGLVGTQAAELSLYFNDSIFLNTPFIASALTSTELNEVDSQESLAEYSALIYIFSAQTGIETWATQLWLHSRELYIPSIVAVIDLEKSEDLDFEDSALIIGRILDPVITPHLILHSDEGEPIALIDIENLTITRYDMTPPIVQPAESEHNLLVLEFRQELFAKYEEMGRDGFENALLFPAIPLVISSNGLGTHEILELLQKI